MSVKLVEVTRGDIVESIHRGDIAVVNNEGNLIFKLGSINHMCYMRSASKPIQVIAALEAGIVEKYGLSLSEIAITMSSHSGEKIHIDTLNSMMQKTGISADDLLCGTHEPLGIEAARKLISDGLLPNEKGIASVNARELAKSLGCSIQPVFRNFQSMDNLKKDLYKKAENIYEDYMRRGMERHRIPFLGLGLEYIDFAKNEKNLFKLLFMSDEFKGKGIFDMIEDDENQRRVEMISGMTGLNSENAEQLFVDIWLITHGIASIVATNDCHFSEEQTLKILMDSFFGIKYQLSIKED